MTHLAWMYCSNYVLEDWDACGPNNIDSRLYGSIRSSIEATNTAVRRFGYQQEHLTGNILGRLSTWATRQLVLERVT